MRLARLAAATLLVQLLSACSLAAVNDAVARSSPALVSQRSFGWGQRPELELEAGVPDTKAEVLARFGPPGELLPLVDGDVFLYRWRVLDLEALNLHSGFVAPVALPLYGRFDGDQRDRSLMFAFDREGRLRSWALDTGGVLRLGQDDLDLGSEVSPEEDDA